jgi:excisionase family DNA binding protein
MASAAECGHVVIGGDALALAVDPGRLRRLRVRHRADQQVYGDLLALSAILLSGRDGTTGLAVVPVRGHAGHMSTNEAAARLGVTSDAVRRACREGRIPARKLGREWLVEVA